MLNNKPNVVYDDEDRNPDAFEVNSIAVILHIDRAIKGISLQNQHKLDTATQKTCQIDSPQLKASEAKPTANLGETHYKRL